MSKRDFLEYRKNRDKLRLNLGCGRTNPEKYWGIDIQDLEGVDEVADLSKKIPKDVATFDEVLAHDFVEHMPQEKSIHIMEEIYRVLKPGGFANITVPSTDFGGKGAFQDPTHISFWNEDKFRYFLHEKYSNFRLIYNIQCWFKPLQIRTYLNEWNVPYVNAVLEKGLKDG